MEATVPGRQRRSAALCRATHAQTGRARVVRGKAGAHREGQQGRAMTRDRVNRQVWAPRPNLGQRFHLCLDLASVLVHGHCERGSQYVSIRYSERLAETNIESSVGSRSNAAPVH